MSGGCSAATYYTLDGGATQTYSAPFAVSGEGSHTVVYWSVDAAGSGDANAGTGYVNIDHTAPVTTATGLQAGATAGWQNTSQQVSLATTDALSGTAATWYQLDSQSAQPYTNAFGISGQGSHKVTYWSVDAAGNVETPANVGYVNIDATPPTVADNSDSAWHNAPVVVTLTPADTGGSGVAKTQYRAAGLLDVARHDEQPVHRAGALRRLKRRHSHLRVPGHRQRRHLQRHAPVHGEDRHPGAGRHARPTSPPTTCPAGPTRARRRSAWRPPTPARASSRSSTRSTASARPRTPPFAVAGIGSHAVVYTATDQLGNTTQKTGYVNISNPYAQATNLAADATSGWHNATTAVTITGTGDHTPITVFYSTDSGTTWTTAPANPATVTFSTQGSHAVWFYAQNAIGAEELAVPRKGLLQHRPDKAGDHGDRPAGDRDRRLADHAADGHPYPERHRRRGPGGHSYTIDGGAATPYTAPFAISTNGSHKVTYSRPTVPATSNRPRQVGYVNIDTQAPTRPRPPRCGQATTRAGSRRRRPSTSP